MVDLAHGWQSAKGSSQLDALSRALVADPSVDVVGQLADVLKAKPALDQDMETKWAQGLLALVRRLATDPRLLADGLKKVASFLKVVPKPEDDFNLWERVTSQLLDAQVASQKLGAITADDPLGADLVRSRSVVAEATNAMASLDAIVHTSRWCDGSLQKAFEQMLKEVVTPVQNSLLEVLHAGVVWFVILLERKTHESESVVTDCWRSAPWRPLVRGEAC